MACLVYRTKEGEWKASILFSDGTRKTRQFAIRLYGEERARELAIAARVELLKQVHGHVVFMKKKISTFDHRITVMSLPSASIRSKMSLRRVLTAGRPVET